MCGYVPSPGSKQGGAFKLGVGDGGWKICGLYGLMTTGHPLLLGYLKVTGDKG